MDTMHFLFVYSRTGSDDQIFFCVELVHINQYLTYTGCYFFLIIITKQVLVRIGGLQGLSYLSSLLEYLLSMLNIHRFHSISFTINFISISSYMFFLLDTMPFLYIGQLLRISTSCTYVSATFFFLEYELLNNCRIGLNVKGTHPT